jgi:hypothetical protein
MPKMNERLTEPGGNRSPSMSKASGKRAFPA